MNHRQTLDRILSTGAIGIIRASTDCDLVAIVKALWAGGLDVIEITSTTPRAAEAIEEVSSALPDVLIGAGTVLTPETAASMLDAGARFLVSPSFDPGVLEAARTFGAVSVPGALTPTEILSAWQAGADLVKVFPAATHGSSYLRALRGPLPEIRLAPTGGVTGLNAGEYFMAGATVVCVGGWLVPRDAIRLEDYLLMTQRAQTLMSVVSQSRKRKEQ